MVVSSPAISPVTLSDEVQRGQHPDTVRRPRLSEQPTHRRSGCHSLRNTTREARDQESGDHAEAQRRRHRGQRDDVDGHPEANPGGRRQSSSERSPETVEDHDGREHNGRHQCALGPAVVRRDVGPEGLVEAPPPPPSGQVATNTAPVTNSGRCASVGIVMRGLSERIVPGRRVTDSVVKAMSPAHSRSTATSTTKTS